MALRKKAETDADTKPGFYRQNSAASDLSKIESGAVGANIDDSDDSVGGTRDAESNPDNGFTNAVVGNDEKSNEKGGFFKKKGPILSIILLLLGVGGITLGSQSLMPFSLIEQFRETYDSITTSTNLRSKTFLKLQLENKEIENPIAKKYFGIAGEDVFKISEKQKTKLAKQGIYVEEDFGGTGKTAMLFDDGTGSLKVVAANSDAAELFKGVGDVGEIHGMKVDVSDAMDFEMKFEASGDFRNGYIKSSRTWRGAVGAWFDSITLKFLDSNSITRNRFKDFRDKVNSEANGNTRQEAIDLMNKTKQELGADLTRRGATYEYPEVDNDGNPVIDPETNEQKVTKLELEYDANKKVWRPAEYTGYDFEIEEGTSEFRKINFDDEISVVNKMGNKMSKAEAREVVNNAKEASGASKISGTANVVVNATCAVFNVVGTVELLVAAHEGLQIIQLVTGYFEAIDKVKAGDGKDSPINDLANGLTMQVDTTEEIYMGENDETETSVIPGHENMTAMQSAGITSLYANTNIDPEDKGVENFNIGSRINSIMGEVGTSLAAFSACAIAKMATSLISAVIDGIAIATCFTPAFMVCIGKKLADYGLSAGAAIAISAAISGAMKYLLPFATKVFTRDLISDLAGEDLGNALMSGANMYMGNNHRAGGGSLTTVEKYAQFKANQQNVIAEEARYQRETRSPFDTSSQYTFMGSLIKQAITLSTFSSGPANILKSIGGLMSNSITSLLPSAFAVNVVDTMPNPETYEQYCPQLASIGAIGDAYCNPYIISDLDTISMSPEEIVDKVNDGKNLDEEGNVNDGSELAQYIKYCGGRASPFGVIDTNITADFSTDVKTGNASVDTVANGAIGAIPVIGDMFEFVTDIDQLANMGWISGKSCVAGNDGESIGDNSIDWEEKGKYFQRFIEDQRIMESISDDYTSVVTAFLNEHPNELEQDNSYEAVLARYSGLNKDIVVAVLDYVEYEKYVSDYMPNTRYAFVEKNDNAINIKSETRKENIAKMIINYTYYTNRNRYLVTA